jgi:hypothetical protein
MDPVIAKEIIEQDSVCSPTDSNENKRGHEKTGETLFTTKSDEIKTQSEGEHTLSCSIISFAIVL